MGTAVPLSELLRRLGQTPDQVAASLKKEGVQGVRNTTRLLNPIVRLVEKEMPGAQSVDVIQGDKLRRILPDGAQEEVPLPGAVQEFLDAFHRGAYPELEMV
jgi:hypothetical protein